MHLTTTMPFTIIDEALGLFGNEHRRLGQAQLDVSGGRLTVSNIGSSGLDGVSIDLGDVDRDGRLDVAVTRTPLPNPGQRFHASATGTVGGVPGSPLGESWIDGGANLQIHTDFAPLGATAVRFQVYQGGVFVGETLNPGPVGNVGFAVPIFGPPEITCCGKLQPSPVPGGVSPPCFYYKFDRPAEFHTGPDIWPGDEIRLLADQTAAPVEGIGRFDITGTDLGALTIISENIHNFLAWLAEHFTPSQIADPLFTGFGSDIDNDGLTLEQEFAYGTNPLVPDNLPVSVETRVGLGGPHLNMVSVRPDGLSGVEYDPQFSTDLVTWTSDPAFIVLVDAISLGNGFTRYVYEILTPIPADNRLFLREVVTVVAN